MEGLLSFQIKSAIAHRSINAGTLFDFVYMRVQQSTSVMKQIYLDSLSAQILNKKLKWLLKLYR